MNAAETRSKLEKIAIDIHRYNPDAAENLRELADALDGGPNADAWAFSDLRSLINPERISDSLGGNPAADLLTRGLEVLRNSLVLLPVAITWLGIFLAVDGYYKLIAARPELAGQSFIYLWQGGFGGIDPVPLGTLALIDGLLLAGVFFLTLFAYTRSAWVQMTHQRFGFPLEQELGQALAEAELLLAPRRGLALYTSLHELERNMHSVIQQIGVERERLDELAKRREQELGDLTGVTDNLKNNTNMFLNAIQLLATTQSATLAQIDGVNNSVKGLTASQRDVAGYIRHLVEQQRADQASKIGG